MRRAHKHQHEGHHLLILGRMSSSTIQETLVLRSAEIQKRSRYELPWTTTGRRLVNLLSSDLMKTRVSHDKQTQCRDLRFDQFATERWNPKSAPEMENLRLSVVQHNDDVFLNANESVLIYRLSL